ncbi:MAG: CoA-binding protein [Bradyrhizobiaceae bacterium]|nr:MAG: CoA-binding protein [Bradyrhizobiaceae bacterium]
MPLESQDTVGESALKALLAPRSIAILGASSDFRKISGRPLKHLLDKGYAGRIYPVNPRAESIGGLRAYPSVGAIEGEVDLAIIVLPASEVLGAVRELGAKNVPAAIIFSSGFSEMGDAGRQHEREVIEAARAGGVRICGPNCLGLINAFDKVIATFSQYADAETPSGPVGFVTQSGAFGTAIAALARRRGLGLGYFVNTGNEADLNFSEIMREVICDPRVKVGAGYIEGLKNGNDFTALAEAAMAAAKPLVVTKVGRLGAGARAAASHTGSLAGDDVVFDGIARQYGVIRARNEEHMLDIVEVLSCCKLPEGNGIGLLTQSGGAGVLMADRAQEVGLSVPILQPETQKALHKVIPGFGAVGNPVDVTGQFVADPNLLLESVKLMLADPNIDVGIIWFQLMEGHVEKLVQVLKEIRDQVTKPFVVCWVAAPEAGVRALRDLGIAVLRGAEPAVDAVAALVHYAQARRTWLERSGQRKDIKIPRIDIQSGGVLSTMDGVQLLDRNGVPHTATVLAKSADEAANAARTIGYPVAVKIESPDILHKTEAGGVMLRLNNDDDVRSAFDTIMDRARRHDPAARLEGVIVQGMAGGDTEFVIGLQNDPVFGPVIMAGLGGVLIEVLRDVAFRKVPLCEGEAGDMLDDLHGKAVLGGVRGRPAVDRKALTQMICAVSRLGAALGPRLSTLDLNPIMLGPKTATAVDWLMMLNANDGSVPGHHTS